MIWCIGKWYVQSPKWCFQSLKWCFHSPNFRQRCKILETNVHENCKPIREYENFIGSLVRYSIDDQIYHISCIKYESSNKPHWFGNAYSMKCWKMKFSYNILGTYCTNEISAKAVGHLINVLGQLFCLLNIVQGSNAPKKIKSIFTLHFVKLNFVLNLILPHSPCLSTIAYFKSI